MGRSERRLFPELYPLHAFANELRKVRARADSPTYAAMARRTGRSSTALSEAAGGDKLPTWDTVVSYVTACGENPNEYRALWETAHEQKKAEGITDYDPASTMTVPASLSNPPRYPARLFIGRDGVLAEMEELLQQKGSGLAIGPALHGLGGVGKTELAIQFTYLHQNMYNPVWWVNADTAENVTAGLAALTRSLEPRWPISAGAADTAAWAIRWLATHENWLLVLDNVVNVQTIEPVLAIATRGRIVVTSRRYLDWRALGLSPLFIPVLTTEESVDLLAQRTGRHSDLGELTTLASEFNGLPLVLNHAAAYLVERPHVQLAQYRDWLNEQPLKLLGTPSPTHPGDGLVAKTWQVSIDAITAADPLADTVLNVIAHLASDHIPVSLFSPLASPLAVENAVSLLASYSMVTRTTTSLSVHRLVQAVVRSEHTDGEFLTLAIDLLRRALPDDDPEIAIDDWATWAEFAPHVGALSVRLSDYEALMKAPDVERVGDVLQRCAFYHRGQGRYAAAVALFEQSLAIRQRSFGADHLSTIEAKYVLAGGYWSIGRFEDAVTLASSTFEARRSALGADHLDTLQNAIHVGLGLRELGRLDEAIELTEETLDKLVRVAGNDHPETLRARNNLAGCYRAADRHTEAMALYLSTLEDRRRILGPRHPDTLQSQHNLAGGYEAMGHLPEAIDLLEAILDIRVELLGSDHPDTSHTRFNLARVCAAAGRHDQAKTLLLKTVESRRWRLGPDHPDTLKAEVSLAEV
ncbi:FxSxx-COOH system tetratricopeptide repeat protein [Amycolatopsis sp. NBC_01307]|uniref:FxSxx-COOH system tetratricopeptide repeat protein n=1 Tax=Amycolatopsis sp. NBC_01307 TaxID=2903561 RepID=UPI002E12F4B7|nr:FxSxx-COOH system tetratricopeptide repeat protein [Amycolatopsis sp. NBC_01307]